MSSIHSGPLTPETMVRGGRYNWKNQPERLVYLGRNWGGNGYWHQFAKVEDPRKVWCEVLDADLHMLEVTSDQSPSWAESERFAELPEIDAALKAFSQDSTSDNAICLVQEVLKQAAAICAPTVTVHKSSAVGKTEVPDGVLDSYKIALQEWLDKTEWVQKTCAGHELGMHRADVLKLRIESLQSRLSWAQGIADDFKAEVESQKKLLDGLRDLCGYVENGTSTTLKISQDDATKDWVVTVGKDSVFGRSFKDVVLSAIEKFGGGL